MTTTIRRQGALFALVSLSIVTVAVLLLRSALYARNAEALAWGVTFDLTVTIPLAYWFLLVRTGRARPVTIAPVFVLCVALASRIVPAEQQQFLHQLRWLAAPLDVLTLWLVARRLARGGGTGSKVLDHVVTMELTLLRYGLVSWRKKAPAGFTFHKGSGWGSVLAALVIVVVAESLAAHLLIQRWSVAAAWLFTALDLYGILWLFGDYHALRLRPTTIEAGVLHLRYGFRWSADVPVEAVEAVEPIRGEWAKAQGVLKVAMLDEPTLLISLREPVQAVGFGGLFTRRVDRLALRPDEPAAFEQALRASMG